MNIEALTFAAFKVVSFAASGAAGSAGAILVFGETAEGLALLAISGICTVVSGLYYRAHDSEGPVKDLVVTLLMPFIVGALVSGPASEIAAREAQAYLDVKLSPLAAHGISGSIVGLAITPLTRAGFSGGLGNIRKAIEAALAALKGKAP